jgi:hypothetical protein
MDQRVGFCYKIWSLSHIYVYIYIIYLFNFFVSTFVIIYIHVRFVLQVVGKLIVLVGMTCFENVCAK